MRFYIVVLCLFVLAGCKSSPNTLEQEIKNVIQDKNATVGVAVIYSGKDTLVINGEQHYPLMSVFKFHIALAVLDKMNRENIPLDTIILVSQEELLPDTYSPLKEKYPEGNVELSLRDLLIYSVAQSDNNACDILLRYAGGPEAVEQYVAGLGVTDVAIKASEEVMNEKTENQYLNWSTPLAAVRLMEIFLNKDLFAGEYKEFLETTLLATSTGTNKLKGLLPADVMLGHKTGSSSRDEMGKRIADNDLGFVRLPDGSYYTIVVFVMNSMENDETNAGIAAEISKIVYNRYSKK